MKQRLLLILSSSFLFLNAAHCPPSPPVPTPSPSPTTTPTPVPTPPTPVYCPSPDWGPPLGKTVSLAVETAKEMQINVALNQLGFIGGENLVGDCNKAAAVFYTNLVAQLVKNGSCAYTAPDAIHIVVPEQALALDHHLVNFGACKVYLANSENYKGDWRLNNFGNVPSPSPLPTPSPIPVPSPSPTASACPVNNSDINFWRVIVKSQSNNQQMDVTPVACGPLLVASLKNCGTSCCELSAEKGNQACSDSLYGMPVWGDMLGNVPPVGIRLVQVYPDNTFTMKAADGMANLKICGPKDSRSCVQVPAAASIPACHMIAGSNQGCAININ